MKNKNIGKIPKKDVSKKGLDPIYSDFASAIINNIGDPVFVKDESSNLTLVNDAFCTLFEMERDDIIGKTLLDDVGPVEGEEFLKRDKQVLKTGQENIIEESLTVRGGRTKTISTRKTRYVDPNDKKHLIGVIRDLTERKITEEQLKETLSHNKLAVDISKLGVWQLNVDSGELLWNDRHLEIYGITREEFTNDLEGWRNQLHPDDKNYANSRFQEVFERKSIYDVNFRIIRPNNDIRYLSASASPIVIDGKLIKVIGVNQDITDQKVAEEHLKKTFSQLDLVVKTAKLGVWSFDVNTGKVIWNDRQYEIHGIAQSEFDLTLESYNKLVHPEDLEFLFDQQAEVYKNKSVYDINFRIIRPDKEVRYISASATPVNNDGELDRIIGVNEDVTERKKSEKELKESEERIRQFTQNVPDFLLQVDRTGKITYINKTLEGLTQKDVIGSSVYSWIPEEFSGKFKDKLEKVFSDGSSEIIQYPGNGLKGEPIWFESQMGPFEKSGIITQVIIVSRDVTERKTAELDLKRALNENIELKQQIEAENIYLKEELKLEGSFNEIVGSSKSLRKVLKQVEQVANTDSTVLILGETGTGKELIAKAIHNASDRKGKSIVKVNCSALPADLIESELFGHEKGAFTGALNRKIGRFELANGGTIFLDEIGDLPIGLQTRLLRVLQESEFERVGGEKTIKVDVRVITATNRNLAKQVLENKFRQDLYYRLNVFPIECPPLRDRVNDIPSLVHHFVNKYNPKVNNKIKTVHQKTLERLMHYNWPGNIRELENVIERAVILNQGGQLRLGKWFLDSSIDTVVSDDLRTLETVERDYIIKVLEKTNWKIRGKNGAAEILGMKPTTLESRMKKMNIRR